MIYDKRVATVSRAEFDVLMAVVRAADLASAIRSAISIMRPPFPEGEQAIANLRAHYPELAAA